LITKEGAPMEAAPAPATPMPRVDSLLFFIILVALFMDPT